MQCPDCGYVLSDFERDCPRCQQYKAKGIAPCPPQVKPVKSCPTCGTTAPLPAAACAQCGHVFRTQFPGAHSPSAPHPMQPAAPQPPQPIPASSPLLPPEYLACCMCGNAQTQKVTALCQTGTWRTNSRGQNVNAAFIGGDHVIPIVGVSTTQSVSATALAGMLMPPPAPRAYTGSGCLGLLALILGLIGLCIWCSASSSDSPAGMFLMGALFAGGCVAIIVSERRAITAGRKRMEVEVPRWELAMANWNRLFYCGRCDHVYDPQRRVAVPARQMYQIL